MTTPRGIPATTHSNTFELVDILSQFKNMEVARVGSACGYWGGWIERQQSAKAAGVEGDMDATTSSSEGDMGVRKPRIVADRAELEEDTFVEDKGKGKASVPAPRAGLGDWEIGPEGEACEGWDWAGVAGIWR